MNVFCGTRMFYFDNIKNAEKFIILYVTIFSTVAAVTNDEQFIILYVDTKTSGPWTEASTL